MEGSGKKQSIDMENSSIQKLLEIQKLKEAGVLTEEEFEEQKERILEDDKHISDRPVSNSTSLWGDIKKLWNKFHSALSLDQKKQEELSTNKLSQFVFTINIVSFVGLIILANRDAILSTMMAFPLLLEASLLLWGVWKSQNKMLVCFMGILMVLPILVLLHITDFYVDAIKDPPFHGLEALMNKAYCASLLYTFISFVLMASNDKATYKLIKVLVLATILNPVFYGLVLTGGMIKKTHHWGHAMYYVLNNAAVLYCVIFFVAFWIASHLLHSILTGQSFKRSVLSVSKGWNLIFQVVKRYRKLCYIIIGVLFIIFICNNIKSCYDRKQAEIALHEKHIQDSIANVKRQEQERKNAIIRAEQERKAAIEQARRDSIDWVEHQGFVKKYANIGLIITELEMTRGKDEDGVSTKGIKYCIFNPTNKTIKYVIVHCYPVNGVGDTMGYPQNCRGIGPVGAHEVGAWSFDDVFTDRNDVIDDLSVSFTVVYKNGSSKSVKWKNAYVNDFKASWFESR